MQYDLAFKFVIRRPGGWNNILLITLCMLIPAVGPIVLLGYQSQVARRLIRDPNFDDVPNFTFDRFVDYLTWGVWPFVVQLIIQLILMAVVLVFAGIPLLIGFALDQPIIGFIAAGVVYFIVIVLGLCALWPALLHAELTRKFDFAECKGFVQSFWRVLGKQAFVSILVYQLIGIGVVLLGLLACFVGIYPAAAIVGMAGVHLRAQHYLIYVAAGGTPLKGFEPPPEPEPVDLHA